MRNKLILAIDPGKNGAFAFCSTVNSNNVETGIMPLIGDEINVGVISKRVIEFLKNNSIEDIEVYIEKVGAMPHQGVCSMFTFGKGLGKLEGMCQVLDWRYTLVTPQRWKKVVLSDTNKDKGAAIKIANRLFPNVNLVMKGCRKPHDGIADALCILEYAVRQEKVK